MQGKHTVPTHWPGEIVQQVQHYLVYLSQLGCRGFDCPPEVIRRVSEWGGRRTNPAGGACGPDAGCACCTLSRSAHSKVGGSGNANARLVFVGDVPEASDEQCGRPFTGPAGEMLTKIIRAMGLERDDVYLCHAVQCRPPGGRDPLEQEVEACRERLHRLMQTIRPDCICALGPVAARALLNKDAPLASLRGRFHDLQGIHVMPTHHPAMLLQNSAKKRDVWEDVKLVMKLLQGMG